MISLTPRYTFSKKEKPENIKTLPKPILKKETTPLIRQNKEKKETQIEGEGLNELVSKLKNTKIKKRINKNKITF